jgi:hypothetical protein
MFFVVSPKQITQRPLLNLVPSPPILWSGFLHTACRDQPIWLPRPRGPDPEEPRYRQARDRGPTVRDQRR